MRILNSVLSMRIMIGIIDISNTYSDLQPCD